MKISTILTATILSLVPSIACKAADAQPLLNLAGCQSTCYTFSLQTYPGGNGFQPNTELKFGIMLFDFDRTEADRSSAITKRYQVERQQAKQSFIARLQRELMTAIDGQQYTRARILAIQLAPRLGYKDYRAYLNTISGGRFPNP